MREIYATINNQLQDDDNDKRYNEDVLNIPIAQKVITRQYICYRLYAHNFYPRISSDHLRNFSDKLLCAH